jgi:acetyltransferase-like isoleucine patch superfamily enzyme
MKVNQIINSSYNFFDTVYFKLNSSFWSIIITISLKLRGIKTGKNNLFWGFAKFKKSNSGSIIIGNNNSFRSFSTSNLIGINRPCIISALNKNSTITIGDNNGLSGTVIGCFDKITIENNVKCGANTLITDGDWHAEDFRSGKPKPVIIRNNVWLGVNVTVLKGVEIGENSIIGANSLVVKSIPPNCIAGGNPCKVIKLLK